MNLLVALFLLVRAGGDVRAARQESEMVYVPSGNFDMGVTDEERVALTQDCVAEVPGEAAQIACDQSHGYVAEEGNAPSWREVFVSAFEIDRREVTAAEYRACAVAGGCDAGALVSGDTRYLKDEWPMVNVTWSDAVSFCAWKHKRLPTEAEWEKTARGTDGRRWPWGMGARSDAANLGAWVSEELLPPAPIALDFTTDDTDGARELAPPGSYRWGASPYGALDMAGNVSEWVHDIHSSEGYGDLPTIDPQGAASQFPDAPRVARGGSFFMPRIYARTYFRLKSPPNERLNDRGFRCARDAKR